LTKKVDNHLDCISLEDLLTDFSEAPNK